MPDNTPRDDEPWETDLSIEAVKRYSRQVIVPGVGISGQQALQNARVLIVGMGGLGSPVLTYLGMAGVGTIGVADFDVVELHNLQRQSIHSEGRIGEPKVESACAFMGQLNSRVRVVGEDAKVTRENCEKILEKYDVIVDCCDQIDTRYILNDTCKMLRKGLVSASVLRWEGQVFVLPRDGPCYRCIFPRMKEAAASCDTSGVVGAMCGVVGSLQAVEVLKMVIGEQKESRVILINGFTGSYSTHARVWKRCEVCFSVKESANKSGYSEGINGHSEGINEHSGSINGQNNKKLKNRKDENNDIQLAWKKILEGGFVLLDIRTPVHFGMLRAKRAVNFPNATERLEELGKLAREAGCPVVISCYKGISSRKVAEALRAAEIEAYTAEGGIEGFKKEIGFDSLE